MTFTVQDLPYEFEALEPVIGIDTMQAHWGNHYKSYTEKLNAALEGQEDLQGMDIEELLKNLDDLPSDIREAVRRNGGGYYNHTMFWEMMSPDGGGEPSGELADAIDDSFGSFEDFQAEFASAAKGIFGSGWAWLVVSSDGELSVMTTANQDNPIMHGEYTVLLGIDVWEHAYYLNYQSKRADYVDAWWSIVNWERAVELYDYAMDSDA